MCYFIEYLWKEGLFGCLKLQLGSKTSFYRAKNEKDIPVGLWKRHEREQTGIFCELKTCFYLPLSGKFIQIKVSVH